jgi:hypothetical protein
MAESYRLAQAEMRKQVAEKWQRPPLEGPIAVYMKLQGEGRGDADNLAGFLLDAAGPRKGEPGILWVDDRVTVIPTLIVDWHRATKAESKWILQIALLT